MSTPTEILQAAARADPARPRLTWYDQATGERVELSGATLINWVDKTANLLDQELGLPPDGSVAIDLPRHWLTAVWWLAVDAVGGSAVLGPDPTADVAVFGPAGLADQPGNDELVAVSLRPMGGPFDADLPPPIRDFGVEVRSQPDHFAGQVRGDAAAGRRAQDRAAHWGLTSSDRVAAAGGWQGHEDLTDGLVAPLAGGGSVVWVRNPSGSELVPLLATEQVTGWLGPLPEGVVLPPPLRSLPRPSVS